MVRPLLCRDLLISSRGWVIWVQFPAEPVLFFPGHEINFFPKRTIILFSLVLVPTRLNPILQPFLPLPQGKGKEPQGSRPAATTTPPHTKGKGKKPAAPPTPPTPVPAPPPAQASTPTPTPLPAQGRTIVSTQPQPSTNRVKCAAGSRRTTKGKVATLGTLWLVQEHRRVGILTGNLPRPEG